MSATQSRSGPGAVKSRSTRSGAGQASGQRSVVRIPLRRLTPCKPANVKLTPGGRVKVLDFGLAKALAGDASSPDVSHSPTITAVATREGVIIGTAAYMSPEQARGKPVDKRGDIWAFGVVLYEMLTGRQAFHGETVSDTLAAILTRDPDWSALPASAPASVRKLLARCRTGPQPQAARRRRRADRDGGGAGRAAQRREDGRFRSAGSAGSAPTVDPSCRALLPPRSGSSRRSLSRRPMERPRHSSSRGPADAFHHPASRRNPAGWLGVSRRRHFARRAEPRFRRDERRRLAAALCPPAR